tara:strand:- start:356 stop:787 length:432 start_codon:yes stop_codon:yes gene_type:complete
MGFFESVKTCFSKYADFSGRASRAEFLYFVGFIFIFYSIIGFLFGIYYATQYPGFTEQDFNNAINIFSFVVILPIILPSLAVTARRFHDFGISGWWQIIFSVAMSITDKIDVSGSLYFLTLIIFLVFSSQKSDNNENKYGLPV